MYKVQFHFLHDAALFTDERDKCLFCLSFFTGDAYAWGKPWADELVAKTGKLYTRMGKFADFKEDFLKQFSSIDDIRTAEHELETFRQTGTVAAYTARFRALVNQTEWDESAKKAAFRRGLKEGIRQAIAVAPAPPADYEGFLNWVIGIGDSLDQSHQSGSNFQGSSRQRGGRGQRFQRYEARPTDANSQTNRPSPRMGNLRRTIKCYRCGVEGHMANDSKFHPEPRSGESGGSGQKSARYVPLHRANPTRNSDINEDEHALVLAGTTNRLCYEEDEELVVRLNATFISEEQLEIAKAQEALDSVSKN